MTTNDNEWYNKWQRMTMSGYFGQFSFFFREDSTNRDPKENLLNLAEDFEEDLLN